MVERLRVADLIYKGIKEKSGSALWTYEIATIIAQFCR